MLWVFRIERARCLLRPWLGQLRQPVSHPIGRSHTEPRNHLRSRFRRACGSTAAFPASRRSPPCKKFERARMSLNGGCSSEHAGCLERRPFSGVGRRLVEHGAPSKCFPRAASHLAVRFAGASTLVIERARWARASTLGTSEHVGQERARSGTSSTVTLDY